MVDDRSMYIASQFTTSHVAVSSKICRQLEDKNRMERLNDWKPRRRNRETFSCIAHFHSTRRSVNSDCFWAFQSILTGFHNGDLWENTFGNINNQPIYLIQIYYTIIFYIGGKLSYVLNTPVYFRMTLIFTDFLRN